MSSAVDSEQAPVPSHVPANLVLEFDAYRPMKGEKSYHEAFYREMADGAPDIFWSPYNGGHWIITKRKYLQEAFADYDRFTSEEGAAVDGIQPPGRPKFVPIESDPPMQQVYRKLFSPAFIAPALKEQEKVGRALAIELIEAFKPKGACEFVTEFAQHLPIKIFMKMVDVPEEDRLTLLPLAGAMVADEKMSKNEAALQITKYAGELIAERMRNPGDDLISKIATSEIEGRPIEMHEAVGVTTLLLIGGLDTVASMMGHLMNFLASSPDHRKQLIDDPSLIPGATEEFLRRFALTNPARTVKRDIEFHGVGMRKGDKVMLSTPFGALDTEDYPDPMTVDYARKSNAKTTFGAGPHVCPGSMLARVEIKILLEEWLSRIPDFEVDPADMPRIRTGVNGSFEYLPLVWRA